MLNVKLFYGQITKNFNIKQFKCRANGEVIINADVIAHIQRLQKLRQWYGRVIKINSGYRIPAYNSKIGGVPKSKHMLGIATDFALPLEEFSGYT
ncbi:D-Ala-D-Ala carboxypeptidase family metallohydrolase [Anaeromicrobium sediminis]|nr:D-Ala-D-Ala carboxypeptidase family metallohydrolase [Anaeromicrobium sediminis]